MSKDYTQLGIDSKLRSLNFIGRNQNRISGLEFDSLFEVQTGRINASKINLEELFKTTSASTGTADFSASVQLTIVSTLSWKIPFTQSIMFGQAYVSIYQGDSTAAADQIFPVTGANVTKGRYDVQSFYDMTSWNAKDSYYRASITDTNGTSTQSITAAARWMYIDYKSNIAA